MGESRRVEIITELKTFLVKEANDVVIEFITSRRELFSFSICLVCVFRPPPRLGAITDQSYFSGRRPSHHNYIVLCSEILGF
ncbi:hypothetical protein K2173_027630 [Erythroxylum novogranatense]|uniref:Uncharacterized protein n=1 Tax=Erythroxylum novogranatense TaxID=1862640 RepID=A0AAV8TZW6_9ROSI|nr:hypothetical protein K2173_027630 [Erythroxylum novogranatense]